MQGKNVAERKERVCPLVCTEIAETEIEMQTNSFAAVITFSLAGGVKVDKQAFCRVLAGLW